MVFQQVVMIQLLHSFDTLLAGQRRKILYRSAFECPWIQSPSALSQQGPSPTGLQPTRLLANWPWAKQTPRYGYHRILKYMAHQLWSVEPQHLNYSIWGDKSKSFSKKTLLKWNNFYPKGSPKWRRNSSKDFPTPNYLVLRFHKIIKWPTRRQ